jgi:hypothetical protein
VPDWDIIGFPIVEAEGDGSFVVTKIDGSGGLVTPATVAEQMLYEIGDPRAYHVPDVACDFTEVRYEQVGKDRVRVSGAKGRPPTDTYKVSCTFMDGFRNMAFLTIAGEHAAAKARRTGEALFKRMERMLGEQGLPPFSEKRIEIIGAEDMYGAHAKSNSREVVLKMAIKTPSKATAELFAREFAAAGTSMSPGTTGLVGGRPTPTPVIRLFSFLIPKREVPITLQLGAEATPVAVPVDGGFDETTVGPARRYAETPAIEGFSTVPLMRLAHGRSGDKGDKANIGVIARKPEYLPLLNQWLTPERVAAHFAHNKPSRVERFDLPGTHSMNFLLHDVLGGGGMASLRTDNLAKCYCQVLLAMEVPVPDDISL